MELSFLPPEHQEKIDKLDINKLNTNSLDRETTGYIIGKIREKLFELTNNGISIQDPEIEKLLDALKLSVEINKDFETIQELIYFIQGLGFDDIKDFFLINTLWKKEFLKEVRIFFRYNPSNTIPDKVNHIIEKETN